MSLNLEHLKYYRLDQFFGFYFAKTSIQDFFAKFPPNIRAYRKSQTIQRLKNQELLLSVTHFANFQLIMKISKLQWRRPATGFTANCQTANSTSSRSAASVNILSYWTHKNPTIKTDYICRWRSKIRLDNSWCWRSNSWYIRATKMFQWPTNMISRQKIRRISTSKKPKTNLHFLDFLSDPNRAERMTTDVPKTKMINETTHSTWKTKSVTIFTGNRDHRVVDYVIWRYGGGASSICNLHKRVHRDGIKGIHTIFCPLFLPADVKLLLMRKQLRP